MAAHAACDYAWKRNVECELSRISDPYSAAAARNRGVAGFLKSKFTKLLFVDDDVLIPPHTIHRIATTDKTGIVCGCVPSVFINHQGMRVYVQVRPVGETEDWHRTWHDGDVETEACGGGCMSFGRDVLDAVGFPWFRWPEIYTPELGVKANSDDADFCERARAKGFKVWALGDVRCDHWKPIRVSCLV
jgi:GT2 family glycosyltransferase